nr:uncharacterized protein LOC109155910 isoform X1 [Ipomoea batatas]
MATSLAMMTARRAAAFNRIPTSGSAAQAASFVPRRGLAGAAEFGAGVSLKPESWDALVSLGFCKPQLGKLPFLPLSILLCLSPLSAADFSFAAVMASMSFLSRLDFTVSASTLLASSAFGSSSDFRAIRLPKLHNSSIAFRINNVSCLIAYNGSHFTPVNVCAPVSPPLLLMFSLEPASASASLNFPAALAVKLIGRFDGSSALTDHTLTGDSTRRFSSSISASFCRNASDSAENLALSRFSPPRLRSISTLISFCFSSSVDAIVLCSSLREEMVDSISKIAVSRSNFLVRSFCIFAFVSSTCRFASFALSFSFCNTSIKLVPLQS